jgi:DNA-binding HxlR family transcriptional regulator
MRESDVINNTGRQCIRRVRAIEDTMYVIGGKWKLNILAILSFGSLNFMELQRRVKGITIKMLSQELKVLEFNGVIKRTPSNEKPVRVSYEITSYGWTLQELINNMEQWGDEHRKYMFK